jgi:hypothetical protein
MKTTFTHYFLLMFVVCLFSSQLLAQGSLIRRVQEKTEQRIVKEIFGEQDKQQPQQQQPQNQGVESGSSNQNRRGTGLSQNAPDVLAEIRQANESVTAANYLQAKSAVRNALWGVELGIGKKVLEIMPKSVEGLASNEREDKVTSTGIGFAGLVIERVYKGKDDMEVKATIGNDSAILGMAGFYMMGDTWVQSEQTDQKTIQFKGQRAVIRYSDSDGYTLSVPFGQSSVFIVTGINFDDENRFMAAANHFDLAKIKHELGEQ